MNGCLEDWIEETMEQKPEPSLTITLEWTLSSHSAVGVSFTLAVISGMLSPNMYEIQEMSINSREKLSIGQD